MTLVPTDPTAERSLTTPDNLAVQSRGRPVVPGRSTLDLSRTAIAVTTTALLVAALVLRGRLVVSFLVLAAIFVPLERRLPLRPQRVLRPRWRTDVVHFWVNNLLALVGVVAVLIPLIAVGRAILPAGVAATVQSQPAGLRFLEALGLAEVCAYWSHRASHRVGILWRFHAIHHSIEELDWLAAARLHPVDQAFRQTCVAFPLLLLGFSRGTFVAVAGFFGFQAILVHSNVRITFGPLRWLIATPEFHHWHHSSDPAAYNSNFAGEFPLLDALFGTLHLPRREWPAAYGIDRSLPEGYLRQLAVPFSGH